MSSPGILRSLYSLRRDLLLVLLVGGLAGSGSFYGSTLIDEAVLQEESSSSYFEADIPRVYANMSDRWSDHYRTRVHPLFSLIAGAPILFLKKFFGVSPLPAARLYIALIACLWTATLFITMRLLGCRLAESLVFTFMAMVSSAAMIWFIVPETYSFGSLSILWAVLLVFLSHRRRISDWITIGVSAMTLGFTVTNWMAGIFATALTHSWRKTLRISYYAVALVIVLWGVQKEIYPTAEFFGCREESKYILRDESGGPARVIGSFFYHSIAMPEIGVVDRYNRAEWPIMVTQMSRPGSGSVYGLVAGVTWSILLILGFCASLKSEVPLRIRILIWLIIGGQLGLHLLYGEETFLYVLHYAPILILLAAFAALTQFRRTVLVLAAVTAVCALMNNVGQLHRVITFYREHGCERHKVTAQMNLRPNDPWPRGTGHVVLAVPGSREGEKAYHEPGGNFSPSPGSFGLSLWLMDDRGALIDTSDRISLSDIDQRFSWTAEGAPSIDTRTRHYHAKWEVLKSGKSRMVVSPGPGDLILTLVMRSVGPAGGPIRSISWDGEIFSINDRWEVRISPGPTDVRLGKENADSWFEENARAAVADPAGWCFARCSLVPQQPSSILISDGLAGGERSSVPAGAASFLRVNVPDRLFTACLEAQTAHLMMGLVEGETRPGDPMNYPQGWLRDGSYIVTALAAAGKMDLARELSLSLAHDDFFGGFGSEADAPGLAIWALEEVAGRMQDPELDRFLWPHIRRKAKIIENMTCNTKPLFMPFRGLIVPELLDKLKANHSISRGYGPLWTMLTAEPPRDGLICGKMDNHFPLLFVNAVSYRGLLSAAGVADRLGHVPDAAAWRSLAGRIEKAWAVGLDLDAPKNDRTYVCGLWPTWIAVPAKERYQEELGARWERDRNPDGTYKRNPVYTYFDLAETHQWLYLGRPDRVWKSLEWFWANQASPGLFTWWEGEGETNTYNLWQKVRGWVKPKTVTPHYWTAAEMLLLQLEMLACVGAAGDEVIIGAGIPEEWIAFPMSVEGMRLAGFELSWFWDGEIMRIETQGKRVKVRLGTSFPKETPVRIIHASGPFLNTAIPHSGSNGRDGH